MGKFWRKLSILKGTFLYLNITKIIFNLLFYYIFFISNILLILIYINMTNSPKVSHIYCIDFTNWRIIHVTFICKFFVVKFVIPLVFFQNQKPKNNNSHMKK